MKYHYIFILSLGVLLSAGCDSNELPANRRDEITNVSQDDAEINAAKEKARSTLDTFISERTARGANFDGMLKVSFTEPNSDHVEHMWVEYTGMENDKIEGVLISEPAFLKSIKAGDVVRFTKSDLSDWLYTKDGLAHGAYTVQVLRARMTPEERAQHDEGYDFRFE